MVRPKKAINLNIGRCPTSPVLTYRGSHWHQMTFGRSRTGPWQSSHRVPRLGAIPFPAISIDQATPCSRKRVRDDLPVFHWRHDARISQSRATTSTRIRLSPSSQLSRARVLVEKVRPIDKSLNSSIIKDALVAASRRQKSARPPRASAPGLVSNLK